MSVLLRSGKILNSREKWEKGKRGGEKKQKDEQFIAFTSSSNTKTTAPAKKRDKINPKSLLGQIYIVIKSSYKSHKVILHL